MEIELEYEDDLEEDGMDIPVDTDQDEYEQLETHFKEVKLSKMLVVRAACYQESCQDCGQSPSQGTFNKIVKKLMWKSKKFFSLSFTAKDIKDLTISMVRNLFKMN